MHFVEYQPNRCCRPANDQQQQQQQQQLGIDNLPLAITLLSQQHLLLVAHSYGYLLLLLQHICMKACKSCTSLLNSSISAADVAQQAGDCLLSRLRPRRRSCLCHDRRHVRQHCTMQDCIMQGCTAQKACWQA